MIHRLSTFPMEVARGCTFQALNNTPKLWSKTLKMLNWIFKQRQFLKKVFLLLTWFACIRFTNVLNVVKFGSLRSLSDNRRYVNPNILGLPFRLIPLGLAFSITWLYPSLSNLGSAFSPATSIPSLHPQLNTFKNQPLIKSVSVAFCYNDQFAYLLNKFLRSALSFCWLLCVPHL